MSLYRQEPSWQREQDTNNVINDPLAVIYNEGQWKVNKVSPLYNLQYDAVKFKQYASKIRQSIVSSIAANSTISYNVKLVLQSNWKYSEEDADGIEIIVTSQQNNSKTKVAYAAVLLSWGESIALDGATHLPYMLERGEQRLGTVVKATLQMIFDCNIRQFSFTQHQLLQFGFYFLEIDTSRGLEPFTLTFETPQAEQKDKLKVSFKVEDVKVIWNGVKEEADKSSELVNLAYQMMQSQIFYMVTLDITVLDLREVALPKAEVKSNGIVKMKTPEMVNCVFTVLNGISEICTNRDSDDISD